MMRKCGSIALATGAALSLFLAAGSNADNSSRAAALVFVDVNVVPMDSNRVIPHQNVVVRGDRIEAVGNPSSVAVPPGATTIDGRGLWLMPGLIDMHVHLNAPDDGTLYVANGVTTIRNMWGFPETLEWRKDYGSGKRLGPTVFTTGAILDGKPPIWPGSTVIETADDAEREIAAEKAAGYDFVKVYTRLSRPAYLAILDAARRHGMRVVGHVPDSVGVRAVLEARGQESIEHLTGYLTAAQKPGSPAAAIANWNARRRAMLANLDESRIPELARLSRDAGVWNCVTLIVSQRAAALDRVDSLKQLPGVKYVAPEMVAAWDPAKDFRFRGTTAQDFAAMRAVSAFQMRMTRALRDAGARILLGTDTSNPFVMPGFSAHEELALLVAAGLTPYEALRAGTADAAEFLHADAGRVRPGLRADLLLVDANPLQDVAAAAHRRGVVLRGRWMPASELDAAMESVRKERESAASGSR
jgi:imidazolonepropionase-like amidohydrolase